MLTSCFKHQTKTHKTINASRTKQEVSNVSNASPLRGGGRSLEELVGLLLPVRPKPKKEKHDLDLEK